MIVPAWMYSCELVNVCRDSIHIIANHCSSMDTVQYIRNTAALHHVKHHNQYCFLVVFSNLSYCLELYGDDSLKKRYTACCLLPIYYDLHSFTVHSKYKKQPCFETAYTLLVHGLYGLAAWLVRVAIIYSCD